MVRFITKDDRVVPINGKGRRSGSAMVVAAAFARAVAVGGAGGAATVGAGAQAGAAQSVNVGRAVRDGRRAAQRRDRDVAWRRSGVRTPPRTAPRAAD